MMFLSAVRNSGITRRAVFIAAALALVAAGMALAKDSSAQEIGMVECTMAGHLWYDNQCFSTSELLCEYLGGIDDEIPVPFPDFSCESEEEPTPEEQCTLDEGFWNGESCEEVAQCSEGETYNAETNTCTPAEDDDTDTGGGNTDTGNTNTNSGGGLSGGGSMGGGGSLGGQVLGASTDMCGTPLLKTYLRMGKQNDSGEVALLQIFLNKELGLTLPVTGEFGADTRLAVEQFQVKYADEVLAPWVPFGLTSNTPTGYVYKTTQRMINKLHCASLEIPMPQLP
jgi:hypothetical protein